MTIECQHGQLARVCELCEAESKIAELEAELAALRAFKEKHTYKRKRLEDAGFGQSPLREFK